MAQPKPKLVLSRSEDAPWATKGLRPFLEYRDLGLAEATDGRYGATIARAIRNWQPGGGSGRHYHETAFHMIFVLSGWLRTEFEGLGEVVLRAGDCLSYEGEIPQTHIEYSDDFQVMQIAAPADYGTEKIEGKEN